MGKAYNLLKYDPRQVSIYGEEHQRELELLGQAKRAKIKKEGRKHGKKEKDEGLPSSIR